MEIGKELILNYRNAFIDLVDEFTRRIFDDLLDEDTKEKDLYRIIGIDSLEYLSIGTVNFNEGSYYFSIEEIYETIQNDFSKEAVKSWYDYKQDSYINGIDLDKNFYNYCKYYKDEEGYKKHREQVIKESKEKLKKSTEEFEKMLGIKINL